MASKPPRPAFLHQAGTFEWKACGRCLSYNAAICINTLCQTGLSRESSALVGFHDLALLAELVDAEAHDVTRTQIDRRLLSEPHARGRAGGNHIARMQAHHGAEIADDGRNAENHVAAV